VREESANDKPPWSSPAKVKKDCHRGERRNISVQTPPYERGAQIGVGKKTALELIEAKIGDIEGTRGDAQKVDREKYNQRREL